MDKKHRQAKSHVVAAMPLACSNELAAVEFLESLRWGSSPACVHCGSINVYKMVDAKTGERNKRFLLRCHDCKKQFTVRLGTVFEESRLPLRHWCYAYWRAATSKKGVSALEIKRQCQITYRSALFLMNRIRYAMAPDGDTPKLSGVVECDETYVGGKPRHPGTSKRGRGTKKTPVFAAVERNGNIHRRVVADVTGETLQEAIREVVDKRAYILTDEYVSYNGLDKEFAGHESVCHSAKEWVRGDVNTNTVESSFALVKRGIVGIYHNVSKKHLHRYIWQFDFLWNNRGLNDGERISAVIRASEGKRLRYKGSAVL